MDPQASRRYPNGMDTPAPATQPRAVLVVDGDGVVVDANDAALRWLGPYIGTACATTVRARSREGELLCKTECPQRTHSERSWSEVRAGGKSASLACTCLGDSTVVVIEAGTFPADADRLTAREREVLTHVAMGRTDPRIAERLGVSAATIRTHVERARAKLGAKTRAQAVAKALRTRQIEA